MSLHDAVVSIDEARALRLAENLAARLCHDFAGPLGTLGGMLELLHEDGAQGKDAPEVIALALESATALVARVRLLRAAWGGQSSAMSASEIGALARGLPGIERIDLDLSELPAPMEPTAARLTLCLLLMAAYALPRGGDLVVRPALGGGVAVTLQGQNAAWPDSVAFGASCDVHDAEPRFLAAPLARLVAAGAGWQLVLDGPTVTARPV